MIITNTREGEEFSADKLDNINNDNNGGSSSIITIKPADSTTTSSSAWMRSKDPRIVRVSRAFGGKDRHSKVCTIRGLRDRRVRLSVPTAIQLYDLQDRLGLNQPSKVVDWLLNVAKDDIDELPPLQIPPGFNFIDQAHQAMLSSHAANQQLAGSTSQGGDQQEPAGSKINASWEDQDAAPSNGLHKSSNFWTNSQSTSTKFKHVVGAKEVVMNEKEMWTKGMQEDDHHKLQTLELSHGGGGGMQQVGSSSNNYFPRSSNNHSSLPNFLHSTTVSPYAAASYYHFDYPSNFSLSSSISSQAEDQHNQHHHNSYNVVPLQSTTSLLSLPSGPHVLVCPPSQSYSFPSHVSSTAAPMELDPRQFINHFQILSPSQQQNSLDMSLDDVNKKR